MGKTKSKVPFPELILLAERVIIKSMNLMLVIYQRFKIYNHVYITKPNGHKGRIKINQYEFYSLLCSILLEELVKISEFGGRDLIEERCEFILPLLTVTQDGELERRAIQKNKLDVKDCLLGLHIVSHLCVSVEGRKSQTITTIDVILRLK